MDGDGLPAESIESVLDRTGAQGHGAGDAPDAHALVMTTPEILEVDVFLGVVLDIEGTIGEGLSAHEAAVALDGA